MPHPADTRPHLHADPHPHPHPDADPSAAHASGRRADALPLTSAQRGVYDAVRLDPTSPHYVVGEVLEVRGEVDVEALRRAIVATQREAETLRVRMVATGEEPRQRVASEPAPVTVRDLSGARHPRVLAGALVDAAKTELAECIAGAELVDVPLCLYRVLILGPGEVWVIQLYHHLVVDGYSAALLTRRIAAYYRAARAGREPRPYRGVPLARLVAEDHEYVDSPEATRDRDYFRRLLRELPNLRARAGLNAATGSAGGSGRTQTTTVRLGRDAKETLDARARELDATWITALTGLWAALAWRETGRQPEPMVLAMPVMARLSRAQRVTPSMGVNVLPLVLPIDSAATPSTLIRETDRRFRELLDHQRYRGEWLPRDLGVPGAGALLHGVGVNAKVFDIDVDFGDATGRLRNVAGGPPEDFGLVITPAPDGGVDLGLETDPARVPASVARDRLVMLRDLAQSAAACPDTPIAELCGGDAATRSGVRELIDARRGRESESEPRPLRDLIGALAGPRAALVTDRETLTADELRRRVLDVSARLPRGGIIAVDLPRGVELVVTVLAALHAGIPFTCLDRDAPERRRREVLTRVGARWVAGRDPLPAPHASAADAAGAATPIPDSAAPDPGDLAYVLFTSGSTGKPKGVEITRGNLEALLADHLTGLYRRGRAIVAHTASFTFDAALDQLLWVLAGHCVRLYPETIVEDAAGAVAALRADRVTVMDSTPSLAGALVAAGMLELPDLELLVLGGESIPPRLWDELARSPIDVINVYGPTECCVDALLAEVTAGTPTIGRPLAGMRAYALTESGRLAEPGETGRLFLAGPQVARGYLDDLERTREVFVEKTVDPRRGPERLYDTGDLVRWIPARGYEFCGRADDQLEINGRRVEPGEIEAAILEVPGVRAAAVAPRGRAGLVAFVAPEEGVVLSQEQVRGEAARRLPKALVPGLIRVVAEFPVTASGKVDRARMLAAVDGVPDAAGAAPYADVAVGVEAEADAPRRVLLDACRDAIGVAMRADEDFIAQGGDSIGALLVATNLRTRGWTLTPKDLLSGVPLGEVATSMTREGESTAQQSAGTHWQPVGAAPLSPVAARQWAASPDADSWAAFAQYAGLPGGLTREDAERLAAALIDAHSSLRAVFDPDGPALIIPRTPCVDAADLVHVADEDSDLAEAAAAPGLLDPEAGRMLAVIVAPERAGLVVHHLAVDALSWRVLLADAERVLDELASGEPDAAIAAGLDPSAGIRPHLMDSVGAARPGVSLVRGGQAAPSLGELGHWVSIRRACGARDVGRGSRSVTLGEATTLRLSVPARAARALQGDPETAVLAAVARAAAARAGSRGAASDSCVVIGVEGHGRDGARVTDREVGWFTVEYPLAIEVPTGENPLADAVDLRDRVSRARAEVPGDGSGFARLASSPVGALHGLDMVSPAIVVNVIPAGASLFGVVDSPRRFRTEDVTCTVFLGAGTSGDTAEIEYCMSGGAGVVGEFHSAVIAELEAQAVARESGIGDAATRAIEAAYGGVEAVLPTSPQQAGMLFEVLAQESDPYALAMRVDLMANSPAALGLDRLRRRWIDVLERHPGLMAGFDAAVAGFPVQFFPTRAQRRAAAEASFRGIDARGLTSLGSQSVEELIDRTVDEARHRVVDTARPPLVRAIVIRSSDTRATLVLSGHHLVTDGWSTAILLTELLADDDDGLAAGDAMVSPASVPDDLGELRGYLRWVQRNHDRDRAHWSEYLSGLRPTLVADAHAAGAEVISRRGSERTIPVSLDDAPSGVGGGAGGRDTLRALVRTARECGATTAELLQLAWAIVLGELSDRADVVFGVTVSGRPLELPGITSAIGLFATTIPVRVDLANCGVFGYLASGAEPDAGRGGSGRNLDFGEGFAAALRDFHAHRVELTGRTAVSLADMGAGRLFDSIVVSENAPEADDDSEITITRTEAIGETHYPITVVAQPGKNLDVVLAYRPGLVSAERAGWAAHRLGEILRAVARGESPEPRRAPAPCPSSVSATGPALASAPESDAPLGRATTAISRLDDVPPAATPAPPAHPLAQDAAATIAGAMGEILGRDVGRRQSFRDAGGNSLLAMRLLGRLRRAGLTLKIRDILAGESPEGIASRIGVAARGGGAAGSLGLGVGDSVRGIGAVDLAGEPDPAAAANGPSWIDVRTVGEETPTIWCMPPASGLHAPWGPLGAATGCRVRAVTWADCLLADSLEEAAREVAGIIRAEQPAGPYRVAGWSFGGALAHAVAVQLGGPGEVEFLGILDAYPAGTVWGRDDQRRSAAEGYGDRDGRGVGGEPPTGGFGAAAGDLLAGEPHGLGQIPEDVREIIDFNIEKSSELLAGAKPLGWGSLVHVVVATRPTAATERSGVRWDPVAAWRAAGADVRALEVDEDHYGLVGPRGWGLSAEFFRQGVGGAVASRGS